MLNSWSRGRRISKSVSPWVIKSFGGDTKEEVLEGVGDGGSEDAITIGRRTFAAEYGDDDIFCFQEGALGGPGGVVIEFSEGNTGAFAIMADGGEAGPGIAGPREDDTMPAAGDIDVPGGLDGTGVGKKSEFKKEESVPGEGVLNMEDVAGDFEVVAGQVAVRSP